MKRNVYFPEWMDELMAEYPDQNWSAVCQEAVGKRLKLLELPAYKEAVERIARYKHDLAVAEHNLAVAEQELDELMENF